MTKLLSLNSSRFLFIVCVCVVTTILSSISGCKLCDQEIWNTVASPDGKWIATSVVRDCGATTTEGLAVNLHSASKTKLLLENDVLRLKHPNAVHLRWKDAATVVIECNECVPREVLLRRNHFGAIHVLYQLPD